MNNKKSIIGIQLYKWIILLLSIFLVGASSCHKNGGTPAEQNIVFKLNPDPGTTVFPALGTTQDFGVTVTSNLPSGGVKVDLKLTKDLDGTTVFSQSLSSAVNSFTATFQNLGSGSICTGTITVTSAATASNTASKTFKIAKK